MENSDLSLEGGAIINEKRFEENLVFSELRTSIPS
jgi:hypothetical protein